MNWKKTNLKNLKFKGQGNMNSKKTNLQNLKFKGQGNILLSKTIWKPMLSRSG